MYLVFVHQLYLPHCRRNLKVECVILPFVNAKMFLSKNGFLTKFTNWSTIKKFLVCKMPLTTNDLLRQPLTWNFLFSDARGFLLGSRPPLNWASLNALVVDNVPSWDDTLWINRYNLCRCFQFEEVLLWAMLCKWHWDNLWFHGSPLAIRFVLIISPQ